MYELLNGIEEKTKHTKNYISHITNVLCLKLIQMTLMFNVT